MKVHKISIDEKESIEQELFQAIAEIKNTKEATLFFEDLCTPAEVQAMADRWRVVKLIKAGLSYRQIQEKTKVSVTTIGRVARSLLLGDGGYQIILKRLQKK